MTFSLDTFRVFRVPFTLLVTLLLISGACKKHEKGSAERFWAEGKRLMDEGKGNEALLPLERAYSRDKNHEDGIVYLARAYLQAGNPREASKVLATFLAARPGKAATWYMLGLSRFSERKFNDAVESLEEALQLRPRFPEAILLLGTIYEEYEEWAAAITAYSRISEDLSLGPSLVPVLLRLAALLQRDLQKDDEKRIEQLLLSAFSLSPENPDVLRASGIWYMDKKNWTEAERFFNLWAEQAPSSAFAHHHLGLVSAARSRHAEAIPHFEKAISLEADHTDIHLAYADSLAELKQTEKLFSALVAASASDPSNLLVKWRLLPFYIEKGRFNMAEKLFEELAAERGTDAEFFRLKSRFHENRGEYRMAYENHMSLLSVTGQSTDAFTREAGILARHAGLYAKSVEILAPLVESYPHDRELHLEWALALWFSGKTIEGMEKVRSLSGQFLRARIWLAWLLLQPPAQLSAAGKILDETESQLETNVDRLFHLDVRIQLSLAKKDTAAAIGQLKKAILLARFDEERNSLQLLLDNLSKQTVTKPGTKQPPGN